ncbi:MAG TPA: 50S ribosomal protein L10 [Candidatus Moranbacteria bacterium]|nr:50S ribosomal protein L10 [Candidatus Moranbacteria bacterium]
MLTREKKEEIVKRLTEELKNSKVVVFTDYRGIKANDINKLKKDLKKEGTNLQVIKKNLIELSLQNAKINVSVKDMEGQMAIVVSREDEVSPAKILTKFAKENENLKILGGILGEKELSEKDVKALAKLLSKEELRAKIVGSLKSPISGFVNTLSGNLRGLINVLKAIEEKK